jgi:hypothetical protein
MKKRTNRSFSTYQWQWWVIYPNSTKFGFGGVPLEALHENHGVGGLLHLFSGADPRWSCWSWVYLVEKFWSEAVFLGSGAAWSSPKHALNDTPGFGYFGKGGNEVPSGARF